MAHTHCMTVDLEDWYHVFPEEKWPSLPPRVVDLTRWLLDLFESCGITATFFVLGYVAERHPRLVEEVARRGHHIGVHGRAHRCVFAQKPHEFREDLRRACEAVASAWGRAPDTYRAPSFSVTPEQTWVWDLLLEQGIRRDSSLFAARRPRGGFPGIPGRAFRFRTPSGGWITEHPVVPHTIGRVRIPYSGGAYFRLFPAALIRSFLRRARHPVVLYVHPRDFDPAPPPIPILTLRESFLYRVGTKGAAKKLAQVAEGFSFRPLSELSAAGDLPVHDVLGAAGDQREHGEARAGGASTTVR